MCFHCQRLLSPACGSRCLQLNLGSRLSSFCSFSQDFECGNDVELSFTKNGKWMGIAFRIQKEALGGQALYPHVLVKNCAVEFNFGQRAEPYCSVLPGFTFIQHLPLGERIRGTVGPKTKAECEVSRPGRQLVAVSPRPHQCQGRGEPRVVEAAPLTA